MTMTFKQRQCCHDLMLVSEHVIDNDIVVGLTAQSTSVVPWGPAVDPEIASWLVCWSAGCVRHALFQYFLATTVGRRDCLNIEPSLCYLHSQLALVCSCARCTRKENKRKGSRSPGSRALRATPDNQSKICFINMTCQCH